MIKMAVFCPRFPRESEGAWQLRSQACRLYLRQVHNVDALEFDSLEHLQLNFRKHAFRRVLVAYSGYYSLEFWNWANHHKIPVLDVLRRSEHDHHQPRMETGRFENPKMRADYTPLVASRETRPHRFAS